MKQYKEYRMIIRNNLPVLRSQFGVKRIGIFDSFVSKASSDCEINLLIELERPLGWKFFELKNFLEKKLYTRIDICTPKALKPMLKEEILANTLFV